MGTAGLRQGPGQPVSRADVGFTPPAVHVRALSVQVKWAPATCGPSVVVQGTKRDFRGWAIKATAVSAWARSQAISCGRRRPRAVRMLKRRRGEGRGFQPNAGAHVRASWASYRGSSGPRPALHGPETPADTWPQPLRGAASEARIQLPLIPWPTGTRGAHSGLVLC